MTAGHSTSSKGFVAIIDDDEEILGAIEVLLEIEGYQCQTFPSANAFIDSEVALNVVKDVPFCILSDVMMPGLDGLELQQHLNGIGEFQIILMSGAASSRDVTQAFRSGVVDFLNKPFEDTELIRVIDKALIAWRQSKDRQVREGDVSDKLKTLTRRELQVIKLVSQGLTNQAIADKLFVVLRTVKLHRQHAMEKLGCRRVVDLARMLDNVAHSEEIGALKEEAKRWENAAVRDPLTGALNRLGLDQLGAALLAKSSPLAIAIIDADHFKAVNDSFGHPVGDKVLVALVKLITACTRDGDLVVRLGGEEFALVLPDTQPHDALGLCEQVRDSIEQYNWSALQPGLQMTVSMGLVHRTSESTIHALLESADKALYRAKQAGRNRVVVWQNNPHRST